jgi:predicted CopG family antitoxin
MVKTITIKDEVYKELLKLKQEGKSFSDVIMDLLKRKHLDLSSFYGIFENTDLWKEIEEEILKNREKVILR